MTDWNQSLFSVSDLPIDIAGTELILLPEHAAYWPSAKTLFAADTHWGKAAAMRAHAIPIPSGITANDLDRLDAAIRRTRPKRLVLLGDFLHAKEGRAPATLSAIAQWRERHADLELLIVRGNHDRGAGDPPATLRATCVNAPVIEPPFVFQHHPKPCPYGYTLAGHTHPAVRLRGRGLESMRLPCFHFTGQTGTLPAFGSFCGAAIVTPATGDRIYAIAGDDVIAVHNTDMHRERRAGCAIES